MNFELVRLELPPSVLSAPYPARQGTNTIFDQNPRRFDSLTKESRFLLAEAVTLSPAAAALLMNSSVSVSKSSSSRFCSVAVILNFEFVMSDDGMSAPAFQTIFLFSPGLTPAPKSPVKLVAGALNVAPPSVDTVTVIVLAWVSLFLKSYWISTSLVCRRWLALALEIEGAAITVVKQWFRQNSVAAIVIVEVGLGIEIGGLKVASEYCFTGGN